MKNSQKGVGAGRTIQIMDVIRPSLAELYIHKLAQSRHHLIYHQLKFWLKGPLHQTRRPQNGKTSRETIAHEDTNSHKHKHNHS